MWSSVVFFCELSGAHDNTITPFKRDDELFRPLSTGTKLSRRGGRAILTALGVRYPKENDISRRAGEWAHSRAATQTKNSLWKNIVLIWSQRCPN